MSFFAKLYAIARHTSLSIIVTPAGEKLSLIIIPKPNGGESKSLVTPLQITGTPEELDAELPAAIEQYCGAVNELRSNIGETTEAVKAEAAKPRKSKARARKPAKPAAAVKKPAKKKAAPKARPAKAKRPARPAPPAAPKRDAKPTAVKPAPAASAFGFDLGGK